MREHGRRPARMTLVAALLATVAGIGVLSTSPANASLGSVGSASPSLARGTYQAQVLKWINVRRQQHGLRSLHLATCTNTVAVRWGRHLAETDTFYHQDMNTIMVKCNAYYAGETLGQGSIGPKRLVYLWMHSPEHRAILLSHYPRRIGIGAFPNALGEWVVAADFMKF